MKLDDLSQGFQEKCRQACEDGYVTGYKEGFENGKKEGKVKTLCQCALNTHVKLVFSFSAVLNLISESEGVNQAVLEYARKQNFEEAAKQKYLV